MALAPPSPTQGSGIPPRHRHLGGNWGVGGRSDLPKARLNGGVITSKCVQGACLKRVGKGGWGFIVREQSRG